MLKVFEEGIEAVKPSALMRSRVAVKGHDSGEDATLVILNDKSENKSVLLEMILPPTVWIFGFGKACVSMAEELISILLSHSCTIKGQLNVPVGTILDEFSHVRKMLEVRECSPNNLPDNNAIEATKLMMQTIIEKSTEKAIHGDRESKKSLAIVLISGGGSALLESPRIPLDEYLSTIKSLVRVGASIDELNCIRKHLSFVKGGQFANHMCHFHTVINLIISDVIGDDFSVISSGPTFPDDSTFQDAISIIQMLNAKELPQSALDTLQLGVEGKIEETPSTIENNCIFKNQHHILIGSNQVALTACAVEARKQGYDVVVSSDPITGYVDQVAQNMMTLLLDTWIKECTKKTCYVFGGETVVNLTGHGIGGRSQELALTMGCFLHKSKEEVLKQGVKQVFFLSAGTDGQDGPTDAAGAIVSLHTIQHAIDVGMRPTSFLANNDSHSFFKKLSQTQCNCATCVAVSPTHLSTCCGVGNCLIQTGLTGTNVTDVMLIFIIPLATTPSSE
eukprot:m.48613 g.48613  ORF g.48613 m.48613 type:complete len:507 (-) comp7406_c0_seq3:28-1548(-)